MNYKLQGNSETWNKHVINIKDHSVHACILKHKLKVQMLSKESKVISVGYIKLALVFCNIASFNQSR